MTTFILTLLKAVIIQLLGVLGVFFALGFVLSKLQEWTQKNYMRAVGWKGILWTGWIGTPIHELGHAFFAKIFRHKIERIALFEPNKETGELGTVEHSYSTYSLYQRIGNFFIGAAPMIWGSVFLVLMLAFLVPNGKEVFAPLRETNSFSAVLNGVWNTLVHLFNKENIITWNFWLFIYISFCIASHIAPSKADRKGMWNGLIWIVLISLLVNAIALLFGKDLTNYILNVNHYLGVFIGIFIYALILSFIHFLLSVIILTPFRK